MKNKISLIIKEELNNFVNELIDPNQGNIYMPQGLDPTHVRLFEDVIGTATNDMWNPTTLYKNPKTINRFESWIRGILDSDGNLFVEDRREDWTHEEMANRLKILGAINFNGNFYDNRDKFIPLIRVDNTNNFGLSDSARKNIDNINILQLANQKLPQYKFYSKYYDEVENKLKNYNN